MPRSARPVSIVRVLLAGGERSPSTGIEVSLRALGMEVVGAGATAASARAQADELDADVVVIDGSPAGPEWAEVTAGIWNDLGVPSILIARGPDVAEIALAESPGVFAVVVGQAGTSHLAGAIAVALARAGEAVEADARIEKLEHTLVERRLIEQAKWRLVETRGMTESQAHAWIQQTARSTRRRAIDLAQEVLDAPPGEAGPPRTPESPKPA